MYFISDLRPKSGLSSSDGCQDSAAPLCRNPQGVAIFRSYFLSIVQDEASLFTLLRFKLGQCDAERGVLFNGCP